MNRNYYYPSYTLVIGLPEETDDDVDETIEMVKRLERYRCILAPLLYVNYWKQEESMTFEGMTSKQWELFCICWYHNLRQVNESVLQATASYSPLIKATALVAAKWGTRRVLNYLRDVTRLRQKQAQVCGQRPLASAVCPSGTLSLRNV